MELFPFLTKNPIFRSFEDSQLEKIIKLAVPRNYSKDDWIAHNGEVWPYIFLIESGSIIALKESFEGRTLIAARFSVGEIFWGLAFFLEDAPTPAALVATEETRIHTWSRDHFLPILIENGEISWELTLLMVQRLLIASEIVEGLAFQPVAGRLAKFLVDQFGDEAGERVSRDLTLDDMAAHIGTTREMVCRILHKFSNQELIDITRTEFVFKNREGLKILAKKLGN